jgi:hypothetical protein
VGEKRTFKESKIQEEGDDQSGGNPEESASLNKKAKVIDNGNKSSSPTSEREKKSK